MPRTRIQLHEFLRSIITLYNPEYTTGHLYMSPPSEGREDPCIIYDLVGETAYNADNVKYIRTQRYELTVIDSDPDSLLKELISELPQSSFDRSYEQDGLFHWIYSFYY